MDASNYIKELASADGINWGAGVFSDKSYQLASYGGLTASFGTEQGLKVFFTDASSGLITEAYMNASTKEWSSRHIS